MNDTSLNDLIFKALGLEGYVGSLDERISSWLVFEGASALVSLPQQWDQYFALLGITEPASRADRQVLWLTSLGHTADSVNDNLYAYWLARSQP